MTLTFYYHPLASFCWKALIPLYENDTPFEPFIVDLGDEASRSAFAKIWPMAKFPVLRDGARGTTVAESTSVVEYLDAFHPGGTRFLPDDPDLAWQVRMWDRVFDHYIHEPMQKIVVDRLRPQGKGDAFGVGQAHDQLREAYALAEAHMAGRTYAAGDVFTLADCAAAPALFYADTVEPFGERHPNLAAYLRMLTERPAFRRVLEEAEPYFGMFPLERKPAIARA